MFVVLGWLRDYICKPAEQLGRAGPVCPFVPTALNANTIRLSFHYEIDAHDRAVVERLIVAELREFKRTSTPPALSGRSPESLLVVLPDADEAGWAQIDESYEQRLKDFAVGEGLMLGQFHPACAEGAVRNPVFPVSRSPVALLAIRHMALHDALFLHGKRQWFEVYDARFPEHFSRGKMRDPLMCDLYENARRRYGLERYGAERAWPDSGEGS
jgi:Domain of unknown function (DUF6875)